MGEKTVQLQKGFAEKNKAKAEQKKFEILKDQVYRPDDEVTITGDKFYALLNFISESRNKRIIVVVNQGGNMIGQALNPEYQDLERQYQIITRCHEENYDAGLTVDREILVKELQQAQKEAGAKVKVSKKSEDVQVES